MPHSGAGGIERAMSGGVAAAALRGLLSLTGAQMVAVTLQFAAFTVMVSGLGPSEAGVYTFAIAFMQLFLFGTELGLTAIVERDVTQEPGREPVLIPNLMYMRLVLGGAAYAVLATLVLSIDYSEDIRRATIVVGVVLVLGALDSASAALRTRIRLGAISAGLAAQGVVFLAGVIVLTTRDAGVMPFIYLYLASNAVRLAIVFSAGVRVSRPLRWRVRPALCVSMARTALPVAVAVLLTTGYGRFDTILLGAVASSADVGQYGVAYRFFDTLGIFAGVFASVVYPVYARSWAESRELLARRVRRAFGASLLFALPVAVGGAMISWRLVPALPGLGEFDGAGVALSILAPAYVLIFIGHQMDVLLIAAHLQRRMIQLAATGLVFNVAVTIPLAVEYSYVGAAIATLVTQVVVFIAYAVVLRRSMGVSLAVDRAGRLVAACAVMAGVLALGFLVPVWVQLPLGVLAYLGAVAALRVVDRAELLATWRGRDPETGEEPPDAVGT